MTFDNLDVRTSREESAIAECRVIEVYLGERILLYPVVLRVLPFGFVTALRELVDRAHQVVGVEILRVDPGQDRHICFFGPKLGADRPEALRVHVVQEPANQVPYQIHTKRPAGSEVSEYPRHVRYTCEHGSAICDRLSEVDGLVVDRETDVAHHAQVKARRGDDDVSIKFPPGFEENTTLGKTGRCDPSPY